MLSSFYIYTLLRRGFYIPSYEEKETLFLRRFLFYLYFKKGVHIMLENKFQAKLIKELKEMFEGCLVMKLDSSYIQGIPDLLVLYGNRWAVLECKKSARALRQPNQEYYVEMMDEMSFARFISPENKDQVLDELYLYFTN